MKNLLFHLPHFLKTNAAAIRNTVCLLIAMIFNIMLISKLFLVMEHFSAYSKPNLLSIKVILYINFLSVFLFFALIFYKKYSDLITGILLACGVISLTFLTSGLAGYIVLYKCVIFIGVMGLFLWCAKKEFQSKTEFIIKFFLRGVFAMCFFGLFLLVFFPINTRSGRYFYRAVYLSVREEVVVYRSKNKGNAKIPEEFLIGFREYIGAGRWKGYIDCGALDFVVADNACFLRVDLDNPIFP